MSSNKKATTLFNLKDEYLKAKQNIHNAADGTANSKKLKDIIQFRKEEKAKNASEKISKQRKRDARLALTEREEQDLAKSRSILEAKSAVYDKLLSKPGEEFSESILVDFSLKRNNEPDVSHKNIDRQQSDIPRSSSMTSGSSSPKKYGDEVHFSNVDHGEVRSKGVGFYNFSEDPTIRQQQMDFLNSMRESTERSRELFLASKNKKKQDKLDRLNRLRCRLGMGQISRLPGDDGDAEEETNNTNDEGNAITDSSPKSMPGNSFTTVKSVEEQFLQRQQTLWERRVEDLRNEREMEFAPFYQDAGDRYHSNYSTSDGRGSSAVEEEINEESDEIVNFISFVRRNT